MATVEVEYKIPGESNRLLPEGMGETLGYKRANVKPIPAELKPDAKGSKKATADAETETPVDKGTSTPTGQQ